MTTVIVEPGEPFELALKRFKKHYEKPSVKRKRKALATRKKTKRRERFFD